MKVQPASLRSGGAATCPTAAKPPALEPTGVDATWIHVELLRRTRDDLVHDLEVAPREHTRIDRSALDLGTPPRWIDLTVRFGEWRKVTICPSCV